LLIFLIIGDQHRRDVCQLRPSFNLLDDFDPVGIIDIQFPVDQNQIGRGFSQSIQRIREGLGSDHLRIEFAFDEAPDRVMIRITIPAIDYRFSHLHRFKKEIYKEVQHIQSDGPSEPNFKTGRGLTIDSPQVPRLPNRSSRRPANVNLAPQRPARKAAKPAKIQQSVLPSHPS
jgi:hypothetical protein